LFMIQILFCHTFTVLNVSACLHRLCAAACTTAKASAARGRLSKVGNQGWKLQIP
jgi:hypothetical protein